MTVLKGTIRLALVIAVSFALAGCGGLVTGLLANAEIDNYNEVIVASDAAVARANAAISRADATIAAARRNPTSASIAAARSANTELSRAAQAARTANERLLSTGFPTGGNTAVFQRNIAKARQQIAQADQLIETTRRRNTELSNLQARIGGGSGNGGSGGSVRSGLTLSDVDYMLGSSQSYSNRNGIISTQTITRVNGTTRRFSNGNTFEASDIYRGFYGRINDAEAWGTYNGIPAYINLHPNSSGSGTVRRLSMVGQYSFARTYGIYRGRNDSFSVYPAAIMDDPRRAPSLNATFRGAMTGTELLSSAALAGESRITYSRSSDTVNVRLFNIYHRNDNTDYDTPYRGPTEFTWTDLDHAAGIFEGSYTASGSVGVLTGNFAGPNAEEVAGVFEVPLSRPREVVVGAFLAKR